MEILAVDDGQLALENLVMLLETITPIDSSTRSVSGLSDGIVYDFLIKNGMINVGNKAGIMPVTLLGIRNLSLV